MSEEIITWNRTSVSPTSGLSLTADSSGMLDKAMYPVEGRTRVIRNVDLKLGSSKQGKARLQK